jgi:hypothetical protein
MMHHVGIAQIDSTISIINEEGSLISNDHTFSGLLVKTKSGEIIHIFRTDSGNTGNHVGNTGAITKRISSDNGKTWSTPQYIYNDEYDDRVSSGGMLDNGDIIVFFGRYNTVSAWTGSFVDYGYIKSTDGGLTWSNRVCTTCNGQECTYPLTIFKIPTKQGYFCATYQTYYIDIRYSSDGNNWDSVYYKWDYRATQELQITEASISYVGDGKLIGLFRVENTSVYQTVSKDYGKTWTKPEATSLANGYFCSFPLNFYDDSVKKVFSIVCDRHLDTNRTYKNSGLWIYCDNPDSVIDNPLNYKLDQFVLRGNPNPTRLLGYPMTTKLNDSTYLVLYSDSYRRKNNLENADFYQFEIHLGIDMYRKRTEQSITFSKPDTLLYSDLEYNPNVITSSNLMVKLQTSDSNIATIENNKIKIIGIGTCFIKATQNGNMDYKPADTVTQKFVISKGIQTITFNDIPKDYYPENRLRLSASSSVGLNISYSSSDEHIAKISNDTLIVLRRGSCVISANQSGNQYYNPAMAVTQTFDVRDSVPYVIITPNITYNKIIVKNAHDLPINIYDEFGNIVLSDRSTEEPRVINLSDLQANMYFVIIRDGNKIVSSNKVILLK